MRRYAIHSSLAVQSEPAALCNLVAALVATFPPPKAGRRALTYAAVRPADEPLVRAALARFPGATIIDVRERSAADA